MYIYIYVYVWCVCAGVWVCGCKCVYYTTAGVAQVVYRLTTDWTVRGYLSVFQKSVERIQVSLKSGKNTEYDMTM